MEKDDITVIKDYNSNKNVDRQILEKLDRIEHRQNYFEGIIRDLVLKTERVTTNLEENREKYTKSLEIVANKDDDMTKLLAETRKILEENRVLYGQSFDSVLTGESQLQDLLEETKKILSENRAIYTKALKEVYEQEIKTRKRLEEILPLALGLEKET